MQWYEGQVIACLYGIVRRNRLRIILTILQAYAAGDESHKTLPYLRIWCTSVIIVISKKHIIKYISLQMVKRGSNFNIILLIFYYCLGCKHLNCKFYTWAHNIMCNFQLKIMKSHLKVI